MSELSRCPPAVPNYSNLVQGPAGSPAVLTARISVRVLEVSNSCPWLLTIRSEGPRGRPAPLADSGLGQTSCDVDQLSQMIRDRVRGPAGLTRCRGDSGPSPSANEVDQQSWENWTCAGVHTVLTSCPGRLVPGSECLRGPPAVLGNSAPCPSACGVDQLSRATQARV